MSNNKKRRSSISIIMDNPETSFSQICDLTASYNSENKTNITARLNFNGGSVMLHAPRGGKVGFQINKLARHIQKRLSRPILISSDLSY